MASVAKPVWTPTCENLQYLYKKMHNSTDKHSEPFAANVCLDSLSQVTAETAQACYDAFLDSFRNQPEKERNRFAKYVFYRGTTDLPFHWYQLGLYTNYEKMLDIALRREEWAKIPGILEKIPADGWEKCRGKTVIRAASMGQLDIVRLCFETGTITVEDFGIALSKSGYTENTAFAMMQFLLGKAASEGKTISEKARGDAVQSACRNKPLLDMLLKDGSISDAARSSALSIAARSVEPKGRPDIVQKLLENGTILDDNYKDAVEITIEMGYFEVFKLLHAHNPILCNVIAGVYLGTRRNAPLSEREQKIVFNGSELSEKIRKAAIDYAKDRNHLTMAKYLEDGVSKKEAK
jgi:hypothetical protein